MVNFGPKLRPSKARAGESGEEYVTAWFRRNKDGSKSPFWLLRLPPALSRDGEKRIKKTRPRTPEGLAELVIIRDDALAGYREWLREESAKAQPNYPLTMDEAAALYFESPKAALLRTLEEQKRDYERDIKRLIGHASLRQIGPTEITEVLYRKARAGVSFSTLRHLYHLMRKIFRHAWKGGYIPSLEWWGKVEVPDAPTDQRDRELLTDEEVVQFLGHPDVPLKLKVLGALSRGVGGMRTSDLHALTWDMVDTREWRDCVIPRPKTKRHNGKPEVVDLPELAVHFLRQWWMKQGCPTAVGTAVFPAERGNRSGTTRKGGPKRGRGISYAKALRKYLKVAGVTRQKLFEPTLTSRPVDFHSFRRAYCTALAASGVNEQTAKALAGHRQSSTHDKYVQLAKRTRLAAPDAAIPQLPAWMKNSGA